MRLEGPRESVYSYTDSKYIGDGRNGYVPLFGLEPPSVRSEGQMGNTPSPLVKLFGRDRSTHRAEPSSLPSSEIPLILNNMYLRDRILGDVSYNTHTRGRSNYNPRIDEVQQTVDNIKEWISFSSDYSIPDHVNGGGSCRYSDLFKCMTGMEPQPMGLEYVEQRATYNGPFVKRNISGVLFTVGKWFLAKTRRIPGPPGSFIATHEISDILYMMVVKAEHIEYVKNCLIAGLEVDNSVFEFWIKKDFDTPATSRPGMPYKNLRPKYRKWVKPFLQQNDIPIVEKENFNEVFLTMKLPVVSDINEKLTQMDTLAREFLLHERVKNRLERDHIDIVI